MHTHTHTHTHADATLQYRYHTSLTSHLLHNSTAFQSHTNHTHRILLFIIMSFADLIFRAFDFKLVIGGFATSKDPHFRLGKVLTSNCCFPMVSSFLLKSHGLLDHRADLLVSPTTSYIKRHVPRATHSTHNAHTACHTQNTQRTRSLTHPTYPRDILSLTALHLLKHIFVCKNPQIVLDSLATKILFR